MARDDVVRDALTGAGVIVAADRQARPNLPVGPCPFCVGGIESPEPYETRWFANRWPSLPDGRTEVHLFSPEHDASLATLGRPGVRRVIDLWAARSIALGRRDDVGYVLVFENRGHEVGATISHPHGQAFAFTDVPDAPRAELHGPACVLCDEDVPEVLLVVEREGWRAWVPGAATSPYELRIAPIAHVPDLASLDDTARDGGATVLGDALARLDRLFDAPMPYMLWVHQRPTDGASWPHAHVHVHVQPLLRAAGTPRFVAAGELGSGLFVNPVDPASAASALRDA